MRRILAAAAVVVLVGIVAGVYLLGRSPGGNGNAAPGSKAADRPQAGRSADPVTSRSRPDVVAAASRSTTSNPEPTGANIALDDNGGAVESISGEYGSGLNGRRLIDGKRDPAWSWRGSALRDLPAEIVLSFYKHDSALVTAVAITMPGADADGKPDGNAPKDVEVWTSMQAADAGFEKTATAALVPAEAVQTIAFPPIEARYVKVRVLSVQGPIWALSKVDIGDIEVLEAQRAGYARSLPETPIFRAGRTAPGMRRSAASSGCSRPRSSGRRTTTASAATSRRRP